MSTVETLPETTFTCHICGKTETPSRWCTSVRNRLVAFSICFTCDHWTQKIGIRSRPNVARIQGTHYTIAPEVELDRAGRPIPKSFRGYGGAKFVIKFNDGRVVTTTNLWCQGDIPREFREVLPDNATFLED